ncbi:MAG: hypothetical protein Q8K18_09625 [Burkholderiales bacterium]|nr:hypothetical protein [Burkholderiales bacterium]
MRTEVHVHGSAFICKGVRLSQIELALRPWLNYLDIDSMAEAHSLEREEVGIKFDAKERTLNICWTGEVGRSFHDRLTEAFNNLGPLTEDASEIEVTFYPEHGEDEFFQMFVGPSAVAIHEFRRQCVVEDISGILSRHLDAQSTAQVTTLINQLFDSDLVTKREGVDPATSSTVIPLHPRNKHLH